MPNHRKEAEDSLEIKAILDLVNAERKPIRDLFAKALNIYFSPGAADKSSAEKMDDLRQAIERTTN